MMTQENFIGKKYYTTIKKENVDKKQWNTPQDEIFVYPVSLENQDAMRSLKVSLEIIRLGINDDGKAYFWDGRVLHDAVAYQLDDFFILKLIWNKDDAYFTASQSHNLISIKDFEKYLKTDPSFVAGIEEIKKLLPEIKSIKLVNTFIKI